ncbi:MAG: hypothetical protein ABSF90_19335 [Syntrophobacteraceae bacterium]|jgi:hypothetical protein
MNQNEEDLHQRLIIIPVYLNIPYFPNKYLSLRIPDDLEARVGFDVVSASFLARYRADLFGYLEASGFAVVEDNVPEEWWRKRKGQRRQRLYRRALDEIRILYQAEVSDRDLIVLYAPNPPVVRLVDGFFSDKAWPPALSQVEVPFDFYCDEEVLWHFRPYLESIVLLKHNRKPCFRYINPKDGSCTFYAADRKGGRSSKNIRCYEKKPDGGCNGDSFLRLEIMLARPFLKANGICLLSDLPKIWLLDLGKILAFRKIDYDKLQRYWAKSRFIGAMKRYREEGVPVHFERRSALESAIRGFAGEYMATMVQPCVYDGVSIERVALSEQIDALRRLQLSHQRFLVPVEDNLFSYLQVLFSQNRLLWLQNQAG